MILVVPSVSAQKIKPFQATRINGYIGFGVEREDDTREDNRTGNDLDEEDNSVFEEIGFGLDGYIYHPRLLEFQAETELIYEQSNENNNQGFDEDLDEDYYNYNLYAQVLKQKPISFWLTTNRNTLTTRRTFTENSRITSEVNEVGLAFRNRLFPMSVGYNTFTSEGDGFDETDDDIDRFFVRAQNNSRLGNTNLRYENEDRSQKVSGVEQNIDEFEFSNHLSFGGQERSWLRSWLNYRDQTGTRPTRDVSMDEYLFMRHTKDFQTYYNYSYDDTDLENQTATRYHYRGGVRHQLYDSLYTQIELNSDRFRVDDGKENVLSAALDLRYNKKIPFGTLELNYDFTFDRTDEDFSGSPVDVSREKHNFGENPARDDIIFLSRDLVDPDSIELVDKDGFPLTDPGLNPVVEGIHYTVEEVGTLTRIRLLPPDGLFLLPPPGQALGQDVFVNYTFEPLPAIEFDRNNHRFSARLRFHDVWELFYNGGKINESLRDGIDLGRLDDITSRHFGTEIDWQYSETRAEKFVSHSRRNPFERELYTQRLVLPVRYNALLNLEASYGRSLTFVEAEEEKSINRTVVANLLILLPRRARWEIEGRFGNQDLPGEDLETVEFRTTLDWKFRKLDFELTYEDLRFKREITGDEEHKRLFIRARRYFGRR
jgi:hypothetical protein